MSEQSYLIRCKKCKARKFKKNSNAHFTAANGLHKSIQSSVSYLGIPIGVSTSNIKLAREFELPRRMRINDWQVMRDGGKNRSKKFMALPFTTNKLSITGPEQVIPWNILPHGWTFYFYHRSIIL